MGAISHNTSFTHCHVLNLILARFRWKVVGNLSFSTNLWLTTLLSFSLTNATKHGWPSIKHLILYYLFHNLFLYFLFFFFNFPSFYNLYFFLFCSFLFYFLLQPMVILTGLSWCIKFQLHFMSLMPQTKGTFIKIERLTWSHAISIEYDKSSWEQYHIDFFHTLSRTEFDPFLIQMKACW